MNNKEQKVEPSTEPAIVGNTLLNDLMQNDIVNDDLSQEEFYNCISADEYPGSMSDDKAYWIQID